MGACMLVRRAAIDEVGPLDEDFFLFSEETDWCYRFRQAGWEVVFFPGAECVHVGGAAHGGRLYPREPARASPLPRRSTGARATAERARRLLLAALRLRGALFRGERGRVYREAAGWLSSGSADDAPPRMSGILLYLRLGARDGDRARAGLAARARARACASVAATLAWSLTLIFACARADLRPERVADA